MSRQRERERERERERLLLPRSQWNRVPASEYGEFQPDCRLNVDQVPFNLDNQARKTLVHKDDDQVVQVSGQPGGEKRFGTAQICIHPGRGPQPKLCLFFRGQGKVYANEKQYYHKDVVVIFQKAAWADRPTVTSWAKACLTPHVQEHLVDKPFVLFQDNLESQTWPEYTKVVKDLGGVCAYGPKGCTEGWQPIDSGHIGATFKALANSKFEAWMEKTYEPGKQNWEKWEANKVSQKEKRILCSFVFGEAWAEMCSDKYAWIRHAAFVRAGLLCTLHGKNDECVYIEGRKDTQVVKDLGSARNHQNPDRYFQYIVLLTM